MGDSLGDLLRDSGYAAAQNAYLEKLPVEQKKRLCALKALQLKSMELESQFYKKVHQLEIELEAEYNKVYEERRKIVSGEREASAEEAATPLIHGAEEADLKELFEKSDADTGVKGIPDFWLNAMKACDVVSDMIQEHDEPILKYLTNITSELQASPPGYTLHFHFAPNPFFKNTVLKKYYELSIEVDKESPFDFDGPCVVRATGEEIQWEEGKNITKKVVKKKQKTGPNSGKFLTKTVKAESFFNFFDPPAAPNEEDEDADEVNDILGRDYEVGHYIRDTLISRAVLFVTGEVDQDDDVFPFGEEDEDDDLDDDDE